MTLWLTLTLTLAHYLPLSHTLLLHLSHSRLLTHTLSHSQFDGPIGVGVRAGDGGILVADRYNHRIQVHTFLASGFRVQCPLCVCASGFRVCGFGLQGSASGFSALCVCVCVCEFGAPAHSDSDAPVHSHLDTLKSCNKLESQRTHNTFTHARSRPLTRTRTHTQGVCYHSFSACTITHTLTHTLTHSLSLSHTHTHSLTRVHINARTCA